MSKPIDQVCDDILVNLLNVSKEYKTPYYDVMALSDISLEIFEGERVGIIGSSGCGKTTLLKVICGIENASSGQVNIFRQEIQKFVKRRKIAYKKIQYINQSSFESFDPLYTIENEIQRIYRLHHYDSSSFKARKFELMELLSLKDVGHFDKYPNEFSGGQLQRIALLRALLIEPELLILDEPTAMLDSKTRNAIYHFLNGRKYVPRTVIAVTHDHDLIDACVSRTISMDQGQLV